MTNKKFKVSLVNTNAIGQRCGFGEGVTLQAAIQDALMLAKEMGHENAVYKNGAVEFSTEVFI